MAASCSPRVLASPRCPRALIPIALGDHKHLVMGEVRAAPWLLPTL